MNGANGGVALLEADPELGAGLEPDDAEAARRAVRARVVGIEAGDWRPSLRGTPPERAPSLLVVRGLMVRTLRLGRHTAGELWGEGDVVRPWESDDGELVAGYTSWKLLTDVRLALLDSGVLAQAARWPSISNTLLARVAGASRSQGVLAAIARLNRVDDRLLTLMWHLSDRWGRVTPGGVLVPLPLTHQTLGTLIGARRPSVTSALGGLARAGLLTRHTEGWLLEAAGRDLVAQLIGETGAGVEVAA